MELNFECESCTAAATIKFEEIDFGASDLAYCPFCGADITNNFEDEVEYDDGDEEL